MSHTITGAEPKDTKTFFGHPRMLANLFTVEMWERFSFYGMQGIMIYYLYYTADKGRPGPRQGPRHRRYRRVRCSRVPHGNPRRYPR